MAQAIAPDSSDMLASRCRSNTAEPGLTLPEPTERQRDLSRPHCENGPTQNTGQSRMKETHTCNHGRTTTTTKDPMVASATSRQLAAPTMEQRLDLLQPPVTRFGFKF